MTVPIDNHPAEETRTIAGRRVELTFSIYVRYGSHDRNESGERLTGVVDRSGASHGVPGYARRWQEVCPGVQVRTRESETHTGGGRGSQTIETFIRVQRTACPVLIKAVRVAQYTSEHHNEYDNKPYAIRLVAPGAASE